MYESIIVYASLGIAFFAICFAVYFAIKLRIQRQREEKRRLEEEKKLQAEITEKTEKFIRLSSRYFGNMPMTEEEKEEYFYGVLADKERDALVDWLGLMGMLDDNYTLEKMINNEKFRINLTLSEYKELYDHMYGPGAYSVEISDETKKEIEKFAWLSFRDRPERQKVVEARAVAERFSQEAMEDFMDKKAQYKFKDLDDVRKAFAIKLRELVDFMLKTFPIFNDAIERLKKTEANLFENIELFRKAKKEADDYHKHLLTVGSPFTDPRELEKNIKDIVSKAIVEAMKKGWENEAKLREESIKKAVENALKSIKEKMDKNSTSIENLDKLINDLIESLSSGTTQAESPKNENQLPTTVIRENKKNRLSVVFSMLGGFSIVVLVFAIIYTVNYFLVEKAETPATVPIASSENSLLLSDSDSEEFIAIEEDEKPPFYSVNEEEETSYIEEKEQLQKEGFISEPKAVAIPVIEKKEETKPLIKKVVKKKKIQAVVCDKQCCLDKITLRKDLTPEQKLKERQEAKECLKKLNK